jgi:hypothetical protein
MAQFSRWFRERNLLFAFGVLPPALFLFDGHVALGPLFMACVVAGRFSVRTYRPHLDRESALGGPNQDFGP